MKLLILDNYDSFTHNLAYLVRKAGSDVEVLRNDKCTPYSIGGFDGIILSPGPGIPAEAGNMPAIVERLKGRIPILGVCLGHQAIAESLGAQLSNMAEVYHGIQSEVKVLRKESSLFQGLPSELVVGRYHSWQVSQEQLPSQITVSAVDEQGRIMAIESPPLKMFGLQFHPESIMTPMGPTIIQNFIQTCKEQA